MDLKPETVAAAASQLNKTVTQLEQQMAEPGGSGRIKAQMDLQPERVAAAASQLNKTVTQVQQQMAEPGGSSRIKGQMQRKQNGVRPAQFHPSTYTDGSGCQWDIIRFNTTTGLADMVSKSGSFKSTKRIPKDYQRNPKWK